MRGLASEQVLRRSHAQQRAQRQRRTSRPLGGACTGYSSFLGLREVLGALSIGLCEGRERD